MKRFFLFLCGSLLLLNCPGQPPAGYYDQAAGLTGKSLQKALHDIIDQHTIIPYSDLMACFRKSDIKPDSSVWDMYSDKPGGVPAYQYFFAKGQECGNYNSEADCFNREHSFPKSWFDDRLPMYSDLHHIFPTDGYVNNRRANYPFGETDSPTWTSTNGSKTGPSSSAGYSGIVFEPIDAYKGDFARTMFYIATRYYGEDGAWSGSEMVQGAEPRPWAAALMMTWHRNDPVSTKEINRNNVVFGYQANRNPFIDDPLLAEKIWGLLNGTDEMFARREMPEIYPNPVSGTLQIDWGTAVKNEAFVILYDITGCLIWQKKSGPGIFQADLKGLRPGFYVVRMTWDMEARTATILKVAE